MYEKLLEDEIHVGASFGGIPVRNDTTVPLIKIRKENINEREIRTDLQRSQRANW